MEYFKRSNIQSRGRSRKGVEHAESKAIVPKRAESFMGRLERRKLQKVMMGGYVVQPRGAWKKYE